MFTEKEFQDRLAELRLQKDVSAREMSQSIGQSENYICNIENHHNLPSMTAFFYICEYLKVTPQEFFDLDAQDPHRLTEIIGKLKRLNPQKLALVSGLIDQML